ncbi:hypothetical protein [Nocardioides sp. zg-1228]|uniref:hypothetical protein n=1 Tax=Nocardioides sp. zg-1228 TaxID=2763008 RepID=UPI00164353BA|nr:hypothetical protein [Nocardioides sp. zg-1228]MBC2934701.1 hypothetical protein [Nocardioides sp. zg-1228]QSF56019.1 hypothetical protein JX575_09960 [Nocardioides sp. zg-1228]
MSDPLYSNPPLRGHVLYVVSPPAPAAPRRNLPPWTSTADKIAAAERRLREARARFAEQDAQAAAAVRQREAEAAAAARQRQSDAITRREAKRPPPGPPPTPADLGLIVGQWRRNRTP